jgi:hypothetical protein
MTVSARIFFVGGAISYRALFNWIQPGMYVATMLGSPLFQILFFTYVGRYAGSEDDAFFIVGNAIQVAAMAGIDAREPARDLRRAGPAVRRERHCRLGVRLCRVLAPARLPSRRWERAGARGRDSRHDVLVRGARDADRLHRAAGA